MKWRGPREGWRLASGGVQKLFRHGVAGSDTAEYDALANVAPDETELASRVQVLDRAAAPSTPQPPSRARLQLRLR